MDTSGLPDMYALSPRAVGREIMSAYVTNIMTRNTSKADSLVANMSVITVSFIYPCLEDSIMVRQQ